MSKPTRSRRLIALAAAYVVALQALLLPLSMAAAGPFGTSLCAEAASAHGSSPPAGHDSGCPCAAGCGMQCCVQALANPPPVVVAIVVIHTSAMMPASASAPFIRLTHRSPQVPRAPPAI
jgi:hypothetical protein